MRTTLLSRKSTRILLGLVGTLMLIWIVLHVILRSSPLQDPVLIGHRGAAALAPENTLAAISAGIDRGVDMVEIDIQQSADGVLVLMHDATVDRTTNGSGSVRDLSWDELRALDAGAWFSPSFAGERVPSLAEALALTEDAPVRLVIEVKDPDRYPGITENLAALLDEFDAHDRVTVISFDHAWLRDFRTRSPAIPLGYLYIAALSPGDLPDNAFMNVHWTNVIVDPTLIWRAHRSDRQIMVWTVNNSTLIRALRWMGVDGITTDDPALW